MKAWLPVLFFALFLPILDAGGEDADTRRILWVDYLTGLYTLVGGISLAKHTKNALQKHIVKKSGAKLDKLLYDVVTMINNRIPAERRTEYEKDIAWDQGCREPARSAAEGLRVALEKKDLKGAYEMIAKVRNTKNSGKCPAVEQLAFAATMAYYDATYPDACVPLWPSKGNSLAPRQKMKLVEGVLAIAGGANKPKNTKAACKILGLGENDIVCLYALTAISFEHVEKSLAGLGDEQVREELGVCLRGRRDPCDVLKNPPTLSTKRIENMVADFTKLCQWRRGVSAINDACPDPKATLPLRRSLYKLEKSQLEAIADDEKWFWIHIFSGQCDKARVIEKRLARLLDHPEGDTAFAFERMHNSRKACAQMRIKGLSKKERKLNVLPLLAEGKFSEAEQKLDGDKGMEDSVREYYNFVELLLKHPRVLEISGLLSRPLLVLNEWKENQRVAKLLDDVSENGPGSLPSEEPAKVAALILVLAGHSDMALYFYENEALGHSDAEMSELMAVARICVATSESLCTKPMATHMGRALSQLHLIQKRQFYAGVLGQLCEMSLQAVIGEDGTELFRMIPNWGQLFGGGRAFRFPNEVLPDIEAPPVKIDEQDDERIDEKVLQGETTKSSEETEQGRRTKSSEETEQVKTSREIEQDERAKSFGEDEQNEETAKSSEETEQEEAEQGEIEESSEETEQKEEIDESPEVLEVEVEDSEREVAVNENGDRVALESESSASDQSDTENIESVIAGSGLENEYLEGSSERESSGRGYSEKESSEKEHSEREYPEREYSEREYYFDAVKYDKIGTPIQARYDI
jgi:hypothetical protein